MIPKIGWQESYNLNIEEIDVQHKKLLAVANELYDLIQGDAASYKNNVSKALKKLTDYTVYHFSSEETFMRKYGYPQSDFHKMQHDQFIREVNSQIKKLANPSQDDGLQLYSYLVNRENNTEVGMSTECSHDCGNCSEKCESRDMHEKLNPASSVKKTIGIVSGKGGVGKSLVTSLLAVAMSNAGRRTAILDADITGPSIPKAFGLKDKATGDGKVLYPVVSRNGIQMMSINFLLENETDPVIWRGPIIAGAVKQFWTDVVWDNVDFMFVDMPPGTGDVPLTVFQSIDISGIIVVATPQELVGMIVEKAVKMSEMMNIPVLGIVENMSYVTCPDCGKEIKLFGDSNIDRIAASYGIPVLARLPVDPAVAAACDAGTIEQADTTPLKPAVDMLSALIQE